MRALVAFAALTIPFGIGVHLVAELGALGWRQDTHVVFSTTHRYLALLAIASLAALIAAGAGARQQRRSVAIAELVEALPFRGADKRFFALSCALQMLLFAITEVAEGCTIGQGDVALGVLAALIASIVGASAIQLGKRRLFVLALDLVWFVPVDDSSRSLSLVVLRPVRTPRRRGGYMSCRANRPPPGALLR